jgi:hypothetical protein
LVGLCVTGSCSPGHGFPDRHHHGADVETGDVVTGNPEPPIRADADLRQIPDIPIEIEAIRTLASSMSAEAFRAAVLLWCAAWHQLPAGSIPDSDHHIAAMAGLAVDEAWAPLRAQALAGFTRHSDGRLYHPLIVEKAITVLADVQKRERRRADDRRRQKLHYDRKTGKAPPKPNGCAPVMTPADVSMTASHLSPGSIPPLRAVSSQPNEPVISHGDPVRDAKPHPLNGQTAPADLASPQHEATTKTEPKPAPHAVPAGAEVGEPGYYWDPDKLTFEQWDRIVQRYAISETWASSLGPSPGLAGCKAPQDILLSHGFDVRIVDPGGHIRLRVGLRTAPGPRAI